MCVWAATNYVSLWWLCLRLHIVYIQTWNGKCIFKSVAHPPHFYLISKIRFFLLNIWLKLKWKAKEPTINSCLLRLKKNLCHTLHWQYITQHSEHPCEVTKKKTFITGVALMLLQPWFAPNENQQVLCVCSTCHPEPINVLNLSWHTLSNEIQ